MAAETTRQRYLGAVVEHMLTTGRTDLSLVTLATAAGTSDRMLVYYFKTRESLLSEALEAIRARRHSRLSTVLARVTRSDDVTAGLLDALQWMTSADDPGAVRFFYDAGGQGLRNDEPFASFLRLSLEGFVSEATLAARRMGADESHAEAFGTMFTAVSQALACDLLTSGDTERITQTLGPTAHALAGTLGLDSTTEPPK